MSDRRWTLACLIVGALLALGLSCDFFVLSLDPWPDQAWTLLAAERHHRGLGLTTVIDVATDDLAVTNYRHLTYFPPGYPLIVSGLRGTGLSISAIVKAINGVALLVGFAGWMLLAGRILETRPAQLLFALLLPLACGGTIPKGGTTDYVFWGTFSFWILTTVIGIQRKRPHFLLIAATLVTFLIGFRWAAVILIPAGVALILIEWRGATRERVSSALMYGSIPTLAFVGTSLLNRSLTGRSSLLSYVDSGFNFEALLSHYPVEAMFSMPLALEPLLSRAWRLIDQSMSQRPLELLFRLVAPLLLMLLVLIVSGARRFMIGPSRPFSYLVGLTYVCLVGLLGYMAVRHSWTGIAWSYLEEPRYYVPILPAIALFWLAVGETIDRAAARRVWLGLLTVCVLYVGQAEVRWTLLRLRAGESDAALLARLSAIAHQTRVRSVVFDNDVSRYLLWDSETFSPRTYPDVASTAGLRMSKPVDVWIVERPGERTAFMQDPHFDRRRLDALHERFHPKISWTSEDGRFRLYHAPSGTF